MSEKQVPEEQIKFLREKLAGNDTFGRIRGRFPDKLGELGSVLADSESPTDFCRRWDQFCSDVRVIGNLLACLKRDGWNIAATELTRALQDKTYCLPGETVPLHETEPVTVVVFDFPRTLAMIRWIRCAHWMNLDCYLNERDNRLTENDKAVWNNDSVGQLLTYQLFEAFPNLEDHTRQRRARMDYEGRDLCKSYQEHVLNDFDHKQLLEIGLPLHLAWQTYNDHLELFEHSTGDLQRFGYICRADQAEVLSRFSREQQERIATWCVRMPKMKDNDDIHRLFVGFHSEEAHRGLWQNSTYLTSKGCAHNYGVVIMSSAFAEPLRNHTGRHHNSYSISQVFLGSVEEQLAFELEV